MNKLYSLSLAALCALTANMTAQTLQLSGTLEREHSLKQTNVDFVSAKAEAAESAAAASAPESLDGKSFVTLYSDMNSQKYNGFFTVKQGEGNNIVLQNFAEGYDVNATYDASTGKITIPTDVVIGTHQTYGDITLYALNAELKQYSKNPIVGTIDGDKVVFDYGVYGKVDAGGLVVMTNVTATTSNAKITYSLTNSSTGAVTTFENPLLITKPSETSIKVIGLSGILYGAYYEVPFTINETAKTATLPFPTAIDKLYSQNRVYYFAGVNVVNQIDDLSMGVITSEKTSLLSAEKVAYVYPNNTAYNGYIFNDVKIEVDFNIFTGEVNDEGGDDDTDTPTIDGIKYQLNRDLSTATVTGCIETLTSVAIPAQITVNGTTYTVDAVNSQAFMNNKTVSSLTMPASIKTVGTDAFRNMSGLKSLYIDDLATWCAIEFANGNANPVYNVFPTSVSRWGKVYVGGKAVTTLEIPEGVTAIGRAFYGFKALTAVTLPSTVETLGDQSFANCTSLTEVEIPASVKSMGSVFFGCSGLKEVKFLGAVEEFKSSTFYNCKALESVNLSEGVKKIGRMVFSSCASLTAITIPSTVTAIDMMAFDGCSGLTEIRSYATTAPQASAMAFDGVDVTIPVYVPAGSVESYKAADEWKNFTNYQELPTSAIDDIAADNDTPAEYYTLQGMRVNNPSAGLYIKKQGNKVTKVQVK